MAPVMTQEFEFVQEIWCDRLDGRRARIEKGTKFVAKLREEIRLVYGKETPMNQMEVVSSDVDIHPGNLTSCIRNQRAKPLGPAVPVAETGAA
jgi:hypothetical protein